MKGDFSYLGFGDEQGFTGVLHQQGRVLLDRDWNAQAAIEQRLRSQAAADTFGPGVLAVPVAGADALRLTAAQVDGDVVRVTLAPGRGWAAGLPLALPEAATLEARYLLPPVAPAQSTATIGAGVRDALLLEVYEDTVSAFQLPALLLEPALGGPDTTERVAVFANARLLRLGPNDDCAAVRALVDTAAGKGRLTATPNPVLAVAGDCPLEAGGGYTGLEHYLYRVEVAEPAAGQARFKWSAYNGGLVGRGLYTAGTVAGTGSVAVTANAPAIDMANTASFWLEALQWDAAIANWRIVFSANATRSANGLLELTDVQGTWPAAAPSTGFFRLWHGIARVADFPAGAPVELADGIRLEFTPPAAGNTNYRPGDYWTFPVRAAGAAFADNKLPANAPPQGLVLRRVAVAEINWRADGTAGPEDIEDCRRPFRPLTQQKVCCTWLVGDGRTSFGDFNRIEDAIRHLPRAGGQICLLPGLHTTNAVINGRAHVTVHGCGTHSKVMPRLEGATLPIFTIGEGSDIELTGMDMATLGGTAILAEPARAGRLTDLRITHNRILACHNAIRVRDAVGVQVEHNRIRMLDRPDSGVGIYLAADDARIERNDLRLLPVRQTPPLDLPDDPDDPLDPNDPCARIERAFLNPRLLVAYVDLVWAVPLALKPVFELLQLTLPPYRALGGIQLGGGSERVKVLDNTVVGGAGNGITLGAAAVGAAAPATPQVFEFNLDSQRAYIDGLVRGPDGNPLGGVQVTLTRQGGGASPTPQVSAAGSGRFVMLASGGTYRVTEGAVGLEIASIEARPSAAGSNFVWTLIVNLRAEAPVAEADDGFLYDIEIERNTVSAMGLSGIGVPAATAVGTTGTTSTTNVNTLAAARALLGNPVVGLRILGNLLTGNLRNPFDTALRAQVAQRGVGGVSLGLVDDALIAHNRIEHNGRGVLDPLCGIFVQYGEDLDIHHNQVLDNGGAPDSADLNLVAGQRGGIVVRLASSFSLLALLRGSTATTGSRPAARVCDNTVTQPVGCALRLNAVGPLQISDNSFASQAAGATGFERVGGTVSIFNLGGVQNLGAGQIVTRPDSLAAADAPAATAPPPPTANLNLGANQRARVQPVNVAVQRDAAALRVLPGGETLFAHNQSRTGATHRALGCHLVFSLDDVGYLGNQSTSVQAGTVFANAMVGGRTLRALNNRLSETSTSTLMSMWTLAMRANNTSLNQADHCIIATDQNPGMPEVQAGNQVLFPSNLCARVNMTNALLFKPLG